MTSVVSKEPKKTSSKKEKVERPKKQKGTKKTAIKKTHIPHPRVKTFMKKNLEHPEYYQYPDETAVFLAGATTSLTESTASNLGVKIGKHDISQVNKSLLSKNLIFAGH